MRRFARSSLRQVTQKLRRDEDGVTLVELLLALVISAIFAGIVIAVFLSGTLGFRLTNDTSSLRSEADYLISTVMQEMNRTEFDAVEVTNGVYTFHRLGDPKLSAKGILYRESGYVATTASLSSASFASSNPDVLLQHATVTLKDGTADARDKRSRFYTSGLFEVSITLAPANDPSRPKTFTSVIPF